MVLALKCDICSTGLDMSNIGFVRHPHPDTEIDPIVRCRDCHRKTKDNFNKKNSSYMYIEDAN